MDVRARPTTKPSSAKAWLDAMLDPAAEVPAEVAQPVNRTVLTPAFMAANNKHHVLEGPRVKPSLTAAKVPRMADGEVVYVAPANAKIRKIERDRLRLEAYNDRKRGLPAQEPESAPATAAKVRAVTLSSDDRPKSEGKGSRPTPASLVSRYVQPSGKSSKGKPKEGKEKGGREFSSPATTAKRPPPAPPPDDMDWSWDRYEGVAPQTKPLASTWKPSRRPP